MLVGEEHPRLPIHGHVAEQLKRERRLSQPLRTTQQRQLARPQPATEVLVEDGEPGGPHLGCGRLALCELGVGICENVGERVKRILHSDSEPEQRVRARDFDWWWLPGVMRAVTLAQGLFAAVVTGTAVLSLVVPLAALAALTTMLEARGLTRRWMTLAEAVAAAVIVTQAGGAALLGLPYLVVPGFAAGLRFGLAWGVATAVTVGLAIGADLVITQPSDRPEIGAGVIQWGALGIVMALLGGWGYVQRQNRPSEDQAYERASRLLEDLNELAPLLTAGLDPGSIAESVLDEIEEAGGFRQAALLGDGPLGPRLLAARGAASSWVADVERADLPEGKGAVGIVAALDGAVCVNGALDAGLRLVLDRHGTVTSSGYDTLVEPFRRNERRLAAAQAFEAVREVAAREERRRIAREIHDGIAQDLASVAYQAEATPSPGSNEALARRLRELVRDLRLSVFELRDDRRGDLQLSESLAEHAGRIAAESDLELRLTVRETPTPLDPRVAYEVSKIASEALSNVHRHASAATLWLSIEHDPDRLRVSISDDGRGVGAQPDPTSSGMRIMHERADSIGATVDISERRGGGTVVVVEQRTR